MGGLVSMTRTPLWRRSRIETPSPVPADHAGDARGGEVAGAGERHQFVRLHTETL